jgi:signal transduction histidine kinase
MVDVLRVSAGPGSESARAPLAPAPGLGDLPDLLARTASGGLQVDYQHRGDLDRLPADVGLCVYRVVQEGVANVLQHSGVSRAGLVLHVSDDEVRVRLSNPAGPARRTPGASSGTGHGLVGIRERVHLLGGRTDAGPTAAGGYGLQVEIPLPDDR